MNKYVPAGITITPIYYRQQLQHTPEFFLTRVWVIGVIIIILVLLVTYFSFFICVWRRFRVFSMTSQDERSQRVKPHTTTTAIAATPTTPPLSSLEEFPHASSHSSTSELSLISTSVHITPCETSSEQSEMNSVDSGVNVSSDSSCSTSSTGSKRISSLQREKSQVREQMMQEYEFRYGSSTTPNKWTPSAPHSNKLCASSTNANYNYNTLVQGVNGRASSSTLPFNPLTTNAMMHYSEGNGLHRPLQTTMSSDTSNVLQSRHIFIPGNTSSQMRNHQRENSFVELDSPVDSNSIFCNGNNVELVHKQR